MASTPHPSADQRAALRRELRQRRRALPPATRIAAADGLAAQLLALPALPQSGYVAGYWAMDGEIALHGFQLKLPPGLSYCLPLLYGEELRFAPWKPGDDLVSNRYGIPEPDVNPATALEPEQLAMAVMPLVGFDVQSRRLGMGGGWYDRSFAFRRYVAMAPLLVGVGFDAQRVEQLQEAEWDVRCDAICTETTTYLNKDRA